jgi:hypothetical protein
MFNDVPDKGMKHILKSQVLSENPKEIALFLRSNTTLTKEAIGEFIRGEKALN